MFNKIRKMFTAKTYNEIMADCIDSLSTGRTTQLNDKVEIYTIDYNKLLLRQYNEGFEEGMKQASEKLEKGYRNLLRDINYENKHLVDRRMFAEKISDSSIPTGYVNGITGTVLAKTEMKEYGIEIRCCPVGFLRSNLKG